MDTLEAIRRRHSVRRYTDLQIDITSLAALKSEISECNRESGLHIQLITDEPEAFSGALAHYGKFSGVRNYFALIGKRSPKLNEQLGWYGEQLVLTAQMLGLNTCWVALSYNHKKIKYTAYKGEKLICVIALGYGETQGTAHKSKPLSAVCALRGDEPDWFIRGAEAALLAPTAMNQQRFLFSCEGENVSARSTGGFYSSIDLGIAKYHFEAAAGNDNFTWA